MPSARIAKQNELKLLEAQVEKEAADDAQSKAEQKVASKRYKSTETARKTSWFTSEYEYLTEPNFQFPNGSQSFYDETKDYTGLFTVKGGSLEDPRVRRFPPPHLWDKMNILCAPSYVFSPDTNGKRADAERKRLIKCVRSAFKNPYDTEQWAEKFFPTMGTLIEWFQTKKELREERELHLKLLAKLDKTDETEVNIKRLKEYFEVPEHEELMRGSCGQEGFAPTIEEVVNSKKELRTEKQLLGLTASELGKQYQNEAKPGEMKYFTDKETIENLRLEVADLTDLLTNMMTQKNQEHASFTNSSNQRILFSVSSDKTTMSAVGTQTTVIESDESVTRDNSQNWKDSKFESSGGATVKTEFSV